MMINENGELEMSDFPNCEWGDDGPESADELDRDMSIAEKIIAIEKTMTVKDIKSRKWKRVLKRVGKKLFKRK